MKLASHPPTPLGPTLNALPFLLWPHGPIAAMEPQSVAADEPAYWHWHADVHCRVPGRPQTMPAGGSWPSRDVALAKAIGESVERYAIMAYAPKVRRSTAAALGDEAPLVTQFDLFDDALRADPAFPFSRLAEDSEIGWLEGFSLTERRRKFVPATLAHLFYHPQTPADGFDICPVSGYAAGATLEEALLGALCELVERDSLMVSWYQRLALPALDLASFRSPAIAEALTCFAPAPVRLYCSAMASDSGIPAVLAMAVSTDAAWPAASVATAADLSAERAVLKAFGELSSGHLLTRGHLAAGRPYPASIAQVVTPEDHGLFYAQPHNLRHLDLLLRPRATVTAADLATEWRADDVLHNLEACVMRLASRGLEPIAVELTDPAMQALGFHVVKIVVPGMQPVDFGQDWKHLGGPRLRTAPLAAGFASVETEANAMNPWPHPLP